MPKYPLITVIINCFNGSAYLDTAVTSVLNQTYQNWELLFWDNQSVDNSYDIAASYNDTRIKLFRSKTHTTLAKARYEALIYARGEWTGFLDVDDIWHPHKLESQVDLLNQQYSSDTSLIFCRGSYFGSAVNQPIPFADTNNLNYPPSRIPLADLSLRSSCSYLNPIIFISSLYRTSPLKKLSLVSQFDLIPDYFWHLYFIHHFPHLVCKQSLCACRLHDTNLHHTKRLQLLKECIRVFSVYNHLFHDSPYVRLPSHIKYNIALFRQGKSNRLTFLFLRSPLVFVSVLLKLFLFTILFKPLGMMLNRRR